MGFGGVGKSGYGRHGGFEGFKNFSNRKAVLIKSPTPKLLTETLVPPYTGRVQGLLRNYGPSLLSYNKSTFVFYLRIFLIIGVLLLIKVIFF